MESHPIIAKSASKRGIEVSDLGTDDGAKAHRLLSDVGHLVFRFLTNSKILHNMFTIWFFTRIWDAFLMFGSIFYSPTIII